MIGRSGALALVAVSLTMAWPGLSAAEDDVDFDALSGLLAYPEEYFSSPPDPAEQGGIVESFDADNGEVSRWEYRDGRRIISREVWTGEDGETKARTGIGRKF